MTPCPPHRPRPGRPRHPLLDLIVDDEPGMRHFLDIEPRAARWAPPPFRPGGAGICWLKELREAGVGSEVVLITAFADLDTAIEALRAGASDFILKPFRVTQVLNAMRTGWNVPA
jgi:ActR/RegA family two-component response regulator